MYGEPVVAVPASPIALPFVERRQDELSGKLPLSVSASEQTSSSYSPSLAIFLFFRSGVKTSLCSAARLAMSEATQNAPAQEVWPLVLETEASFFGIMVIVE